MEENNLFILLILVCVVVVLIPFFWGSPIGILIGIIFALILRMNSIKIKQIFCEENK